MSPIRVDDRRTAAGARAPRTLRKPLVTAVAVALATLALGACSSDDDDDDPSGMNPAEPGDMNPAEPGDMAGQAPAGSFAVVTNDGTAPGSVTFFAPDLATSVSTLETGANEGIAFGADGTLYQNADGDGFTGLRALDAAASRMDGDAFGAADRNVSAIGGKGLFAIAGSGLLGSCDVTDEGADLKLFSSAAGGDAMPVTTIDLPAACWDGTFAADDDRLYLALTDGTLAILDGFVARLDGMSAGADDDMDDDMDGDAITVDRLVRVVGADGTQRSINFHGVAVEGGTVLVSDVGDAMSATDGALYTFEDDGELDGDVEAEPVAGAATRLGNPVDVLLVDGDAIVAEKSNDALLVFEGIAGLSGDVAPAYSQDFTKPESIAPVPEAATTSDASDIVDADEVSRVVVALNPGPMQDDGSGVDNSNVARIVSLSRSADGGLADEGADFSAAAMLGDAGQRSFRTLENVQLDAAGNAYAAFDVTDGTAVTDRGILVIADLAGRDDLDVDTDARDRVIGGAGAGLTSPKGVELVGSRSAVIVADIGDDGTPPSLQVYSANAGDGAMPMFTVADTGPAAIWDIDYDPENDRLYAAGTAGDILVYDGFFASAASAAPTRVIRPSTAGDTSNIHGIAHVAEGDLLIATDVGDAAVADDGKLYTIENASSADGAVVPKATVSGADTLLGNPVDLAFDGSDAYIAEKSNDALLVYRGVLELAGDTGAAPDATVSLPKPESVTLAR